MSSSTDGSNGVLSGPDSKATVCRGISSGALVGLALVVATGSLRQKPPGSKQGSAPDCHRPDYCFDHVNDERLKRERKDR